MYESLFFEKISEKIAETRGIGIGESLYRQLAARTGESKDGGDAARDGAASPPREKA